MEARKPAMPHFKAETPEEIAAHEDWQKAGGHPCIPAIDYLEKSRQEEKEKQYQAFDNYLKKPAPQEITPIAKMREYVNPKRFLGNRPSEHPPEKFTYRDKNGEMAETNKPKSGYARQEQTEEEQNNGAVTIKQKYIYGAIAVVIILAIVFFALPYLPGIHLFGGEKYPKPNSNCICGIGEPACRGSEVTQCDSTCMARVTTKKCASSCVNGTCVCSDGSREDTCLKTQPNYCDSLGKIVKNSAKCGCPFDYRPKDGDCAKIQRCSDGTEFGTCASNKPYHCSDGTLVENAGVCGCSGSLVPDGNKCVSRYMTGPITRQFTYVLRGSYSSIPWTVYYGLDSYLASLSRRYTCYNNICPSDQEVELRYLNQEEQRPELEALAARIKSITPNRDDQARIAVSFVQQIPYDWNAFVSSDLTGRYPYEVLYYYKGVCGEKAKLLAFLLRDLGFGVALFNYQKSGSFPGHEAVGIKCSIQYSLQGSGFCFVETSQAGIITDDQSEYFYTSTSLGKLPAPQIYSVSDGFSFDSVSEEYNDARAFMQIRNVAGGYLDEYTYYIWAGLVAKYGIKTTTS